MVFVRNNTMKSCDLEGIVAQFTRLHYDSTTEIVYSLSKKLREKAGEIRREQSNANYLRLASERLEEASGYFDTAWKQCKPFMTGKVLENHCEFIKGYEGKNKSLATEIASMDYADIAKFVCLLATNTKTQADSDLKRGRPKLSDLLKNAHLKLNEACESLRNLASLNGEVSA